MSETAPAPVPPAPAPTPRKFTFDTVFDGGARVIGAAGGKRTLSAEEAERLVAAARAEGDAAALTRIEAEAARALADLAQAARAALPALAAAAHEHRVGAAELALACARQIADAALERFPEAPVQAALAALAREVEAEPRLTLRAPPHLIERLEAAVTQTAEAIGYAGKIVARADADLTAAAFSLDWGDGSAAFDPASAAARVAAALEGALAAEGLHAEVLIPTDPDSPIRTDDHG